MFHWIGKWWRSNERMAHYHNNDEPCDPRCEPLSELKARRRALRAANKPPKR